MQRQEEDRRLALAREGGEVREPEGGVWERGLNDDRGRVGVRARGGAVRGGGALARGVEDACRDEEREEEVERDEAGGVGGAELL